MRAPPSLLPAMAPSLPPAGPHPNPALPPFPTAAAVAPSPRVRGVDALYFCGNMRMRFFPRKGADGRVGRCRAEVSIYSILGYTPETRASEVAPRKCAPVRVAEVVEGAALPPPEEMLGEASDL